MAYKRSKGKLARRKKIEPAVMKSWHRIELSVEQGNAGSDTVYFDTSQIKSILNRRFYRQGLVDCISSISIIAQPLGSATVIPDGIKATYSISKLPNTWVMSNAWEKGFRAWQRMNNEALEETESVRPRFLDFKIYADSEHHARGFAVNSLPFAYNGVYTPGMWEPSKIVVPNGQASTPNAVAGFELLATGASFPGAGASGKNAVSLIEGYASSRALPQPTDPAVPSDMDDVGPDPTPENWLTAMFTDGTEQDLVVLDDMQTENNQNPYPFEGDGVHTDTMYPGGANQGSGLELHSYTRQTGTTLGAKTIVNGGTFPCGLIRLDIENQSKNSEGFTPDMQYFVCIEYVPGHHRGYLCEPMTEM